MIRVDAKRRKGLPSVSDRSCPNNHNNPLSAKSCWTSSRRRKLASCDEGDEPEADSDLLRVSCPFKADAGGDRPTGAFGDGCDDDLLFPTQFLGHMAQEHRTNVLVCPKCDIGKGVWFLDEPSFKSHFKDAHLNSNDNHSMQQPDPEQCVLNKDNTRSSLCRSLTPCSTSNFKSKVRKNSYSELEKDLIDIKMGKFLPLSKESVKKERPLSKGCSHKKEHSLSKYSLKNERPLSNNSPKNKRPVSKDSLKIKRPLSKHSLKNKRRVSKDSLKDKRPSSKDSLKNKRSLSKESLKKEHPLSRKSLKKEYSIANNSLKNKKPLPNDSLKKERSLPDNLPKREPVKRKSVNLGSSKWTPSPRCKQAHNKDKQVKENKLKSNGNAFLEKIEPCFSGPRKHARDLEYIFSNQETAIIDVVHFQQPLTGQLEAKCLDSTNAESVVKRRNKAAIQTHSYSKKQDSCQSTEAEAIGTTTTIPKSSGSLLPPSQFCDLMISNCRMTDSVTEDNSFFSSKRSVEVFHSPSQFHSSDPFNELLTAVDGNFLELGAEESIWASHPSPSLPVVTRFPEISKPFTSAEILGNFRCGGSLNSANTDALLEVITAISHANDQFQSSAASPSNAGDSHEPLFRFCREIVEDVGFVTKIVSDGFHDRLLISRENSGEVIVENDTQEEPQTQSTEIQERLDSIYREGLTVIPDISSNPAIPAHSLIGKLANECGSNSSKSNSQNVPSETDNSSVGGIAGNYDSKRSSREEKLLSDLESKLGNRSIVDVSIKRPVVISKHFLASPFPTNSRELPRDQMRGVRELPRDKPRGVPLPSSSAAVISNLVETGQIVVPEVVAETRPDHPRAKMASTIEVKDGRQFQCTITIFCDFVSQDWMQFFKHTQTVHRRMATSCSLCERHDSVLYWQSVEGFRDHFRSVHAPESDRRLCPDATCPFATSGQGLHELYYHEARHHKRILCPICDKQNSDCDSVIEAGGRKSTTQPTEIESYVEPDKGEEPKLTFPDVEALLEHLTTVHCNIFLPCPINSSDSRTGATACVDVFTSFVGLREHVLEQHSKQLWDCHICGGRRASFLAVEELEDHIAKDHWSQGGELALDGIESTLVPKDVGQTIPDGENFVCEICRESFTDWLKLDLHQFQRHMRLLIVNFRCEHCTRIFPSTLDRVTHQSLHQNSSCTNASQSKSVDASDGCVGAVANWESVNLVDPKMKGNAALTKSIPLTKCPSSVCGAWFNRESTMVQHLQLTHPVTSPAARYYVDCGCDYATGVSDEPFLDAKLAESELAFHTSAGVREHMRNQHPGNGFFGICDEESAGARGSGGCNLVVMDDRDAFVDHVQAVHEKHIWICPHCPSDVWFKSIRSLEHHLGTHHPEMQHHMCEVCGSLWPTQHQLAHHATSVHHLRVYHCAFAGARQISCTRSFYSQLDMLAHLGQVHQQIARFRCQPGGSNSCAARKSAGSSCPCARCAEVEVIGI